MKFALASDVHLEFGTVEIKNTENAKVLLLAGDICVVSQLLDKDKINAPMSYRFHSFFQQVCSEFPTVIYIMGNHEHYGGDFRTTYSNLRDKLSYLNNLYVVDKTKVIVNNVTFLCGTLWTDMNAHDERTLQYVNGYMNDFRIVKNGDRVLSTEDVYKDHKDCLGYFKMELRDTPDNVVCVTHHAPSKASTHPRNFSDVLLNGGYSSALEYLMKDHRNIKYWVHGHTHDDFDYLCHETRIVANPRGYINHEDRAYNWKVKYYEV